MRISVALSFSALACSGAPSAEFEGGSSAGGFAVGVSSSALVDLSVAQDGRPGTGPAETFELETRWVDRGAACGLADGLCAEVRLRSFSSAIARDVWVELLSMTPPLAAQALGDPPAPGIRGEIGAWSYGDLGPGEFADRTWTFRLATGQDFRFRGRVRAGSVDSAITVVATGAPITVLERDGAGLEISRECPSGTCTFPIGRGHSVDLYSFSPGRTFVPTFQATGLSCSEIWMDVENFVNCWTADAESNLFASIAWAPE